MEVTRQEALELLYQAREEPIGLLLDASDFEKVRTFLYKVRSEVKDESLDCLQFRASTIEGGNLIITKGEKKEKEPDPFPRKLPIERSSVIDKLAEDLDL